MSGDDQAIREDKESVATLRSTGQSVTAALAQLDADQDELSGTLSQDESTVTYGDVHSFQAVARDLVLEADAGGTTGKFLAPFMGNIFDEGSALTKAGNYLAGLIGEYSITSGSATTYPEAAVLGIIADGVSDQHVNAYTAVIDGDDSQTKAKAAFGVMYNNSTAGSGFTYGLDLFDASHDGYNAVSYGTADIRLSSGGLIASLTTAITANSTTTSLAAGTLGKTTNATGRASLFVSDGTKWQFLTNS